MHVTDVKRAIDENIKGFQQLYVGIQINSALLGQNMKAHIVRQVGPILAVEAGLGVGTF